MRDPLLPFRWHKILREILPCGIPALDKPDFLFAAPALDLFLAGDGIPNVREWLAMHEPVDVVPRRESRNESLPMFEDSPLKIIRHADLEGS